MVEELQIGLLSAIQAEHQNMQEKIQQVIQALVTHYLTDTRRAQIGVLEVVGASATVEQRRREVIHSIVNYVQVFLNTVMQEKKSLNEIITGWL